MRASHEQVRPIEVQKPLRRSKKAAARLGIPVLAAAIGLTFYGPVSSAQASPSGGTRVATNGALVMVRSQPTTKRGKINHRYADGTQVSLSCKVDGDDGHRWLKLKSGAGYIAGDYVSGPTAKLPYCEGYGPRQGSTGMKADPGNTKVKTFSDGSKYTYHYYIPIGDLDPSVLGITPESITSDYLGHFDEQFKFSGCGPRVSDLKTCTLRVFGKESPVRITAIWDTGFELKSLPGHPEGPGRYIDFNIVKGAHGVLYLDVHAYGPKQGFLTDSYIGMFLNSKTVFVSWHEWANKLAKIHRLRTLDYAMGNTGR